MWRFAFLTLLVACTEHGQTPPGQEPPPGQDPPRPGSFETPRFAPTVCTSGLPDSPGAPNPNCLSNRIPLEDAVPGASVTFTLQSLGSGLFITDLTFFSGPEGLVIVNAQVLVSGATTIATELELGPVDAVTLPALAIVDSQVISGMAFRFDSISTQP